jgi:hypothetical protein
MVIGALDTECGGTKMNHQTIASGHIFPVKSFYESSLAQYREDNVSGTIKASGGAAGGGSETFLAQPTYAIQGSMIGRNDNAGPQGDGINEEVCFTQNTIDRHAVAQPIPIDMRNAGRDPEKHDEMNRQGVGVGDSGDPAHTVTSAFVHAVAQPIAFEPGKLKRLGYGDAEPGLSPAIRAQAGDNQVAVAQPLVLMDQGGSVMNVQTDGTVGTLRRETHGHEPIVFQQTADCLTAAYGTKWNGNASATNGSLFVAQPVAFVQNSRNEVRLMSGDGSIVGALAAETGAKQQCYIATAQPIGLDEEQNAMIDCFGTLKARTKGGGFEGSVAQPITYDSKQHHNPQPSDTAQLTTLNCAFVRGDTPLIQPILAPTLTASNDPSRSPQSTEVTNQVAAVHSVSMAVRRLTPIECERLQGFPDNYTEIPWRKKPADQCPDGPRYKALGNSWAVPVVHWIGKRIQAQLEK